MNLDLELTRVRGRAKRQVGAAVVRELTQADLARLEVEQGIKPKTIAKLRERHHGLARALASGLTDLEAAAITGYDNSRISVLKSDPAFKELLEFYRGEVDVKYVEVHEVLAGMTKDAALILRERLEDEPEGLSTREIIEIAKMGADRTGNGPSSTSTQVNVHMNMAERLENARKRVEGAKVIEHESNVSPREAGERPHQNDAPLRGSGDTETFSPKVGEPFTLEDD